LQMVQVLMTKSKTASILNLWLASPLHTGDQQYLLSIEAVLDFVIST
jgi:hypothetical protein